MRYNKRNYFNYIVVEIHAEILTLPYKHEEHITCTKLFSFLTTQVFQGCKCIVLPCKTLTWHHTITLHGMLSCHCYKQLLCKANNLTSHEIYLYILKILFSLFIILLHFPIKYIHAFLHLSHFLVLPLYTQPTLTSEYLS